MRNYALRQYCSMQQDIDACKKKGLDGEKEIECCYQVCTHYWRQLEHALAIYSFKDEEEEIDFFKNIKPLFTSEIEYHNLRYHAQLFKPLFDPEDLYRFWSRELLRFEKFTEANAGFYKYYKEKDTSLDLTYFLRANHQPTDIPEAGITPLERKTSTGYDHLLSNFMALERYTVYVQLQIEKLNLIKNGN